MFNLTCAAQDGYPRTVAQAKALVEYETVDAVMNITLPKHVLMEKLLGRRACADAARPCR